MKDAQASARAFGYSESLLPVAEFSRGFTNLSPEDVRALVDSRIDEIIKALLQSPEKRSRGKNVDANLVFQGSDRFECWENMNQSFLDLGWGDGFPLIPATPEKVERMLRGTKRDPRDVVTMLLPGNGIATISKLAIAAVMAGCVPEHLPILIAAVEGISDPIFNLPVVAVSTGPHTPMLIINGPITKELKINSGNGALGPGALSWANTVIGRAMRLILMNVGHAYLGELDMDTIGSPIKYSMVVAENEEKSPWDAFHVERGFSKDTNTVTVFPVESQMEVADVRSFKPEHVVNSFCSVVANAGAASSNAWLQGNRSWHNLLIFAPDHASIMRGWSKKDVRDYLFHHSRVPWLYMKYGGLAGPERVTPGWKWLWDAPEDTPIPVAGGPDWFHIIVVGASTGKSSYITGVGQPVTKEIKR